MATQEEVGRPERAGHPCPQAHGDRTPPPTMSAAPQGIGTPGEGSCVPCGPHQGGGGEGYNVQGWRGGVGGMSLHIF